MGNRNFSRPVRANALNNEMEFRLCFTALFWDQLGEPVLEENFWTLWCKGRLTEAHTDHPAVRHSIWTYQCPPPCQYHL